MLGKLDELQARHPALPVQHNGVMLHSARCVYVLLATDGAHLNKVH